MKYINNSFKEKTESSDKLVNKIFFKKISEVYYLKNNLLFLFKFLILFSIIFFYTHIIIYNYLFNNIHSKSIFNKDKVMNKLLIKKLKKKIIKIKRFSIEWPLPKEIKFRPWMTSKDLKAFCSFMKPGNIYFEFGSGGSTNIASFYNVKTYSVESDVKWHKKLKDNNIKANYITVDLNVQKEGYPGPKTNIENWKKYIQAYKKEYNANIILIDGRFRVACGLDIFPKIKNDCIVLIHDYTKRIQYHILENYYVKIKTWDNLAAFIKRPYINDIPKNIYEKYLREKL